MSAYEPNYDSEEDFGGVVDIGHKTDSPDLTSQHHLMDEDLPEDILSWSDDENDYSISDESLQFQLDGEEEEEEEVEVNYETDNVKKSMDRLCGHENKFIGAIIYGAEDDDLSAKFTEGELDTIMAIFTEKSPTLEDRVYVGLLSRVHCICHHNHIDTPLSNVNLHTYMRKICEQFPYIVRSLLWMNKKYRLFHTLVGVVFLTVFSLIVMSDEHIGDEQKLIKTIFTSDAVIDDPTNYFIHAVNLLAVRNRHPFSLPFIK